MRTDSASERTRALSRVKLEFITVRNSLYSTAGAFARGLSIKQKNVCVDFMGVVRLCICVRRDEGGVIVLCDILGYISTQNTRRICTYVPCYSFHVTV